MIAIVKSNFNQQVIDGLLTGCMKALKESGIEKEAVSIIEVPGAFEIPAVASALALRLDRPVDAIVCLGVILRGETSHAEHIGKAVTNALMQLQVDHVLPVIHEVLLLENMEQARKRCLDESRNRGLEAAQTAIEMARIMSKLVS